MSGFTIITDKKRQVVDITEYVASLINESQLTNGICNIFVLHTTAALTCADLDPGTDLDLLEALGELIPKRKYRHPHDPSHVEDHILSSIIGPSLTIPIVKGEPKLGTWQRIVLVEFDGPRSRSIICNLIAST